MNTIILSLIIFGVLIIVHELGHFTVAKLIGVKVEEFSVGMGPKLIGIQKGETLYSIRALPLGGFCKMLGEDEDSNDKKSLNNKSKLGRAAVFFAGSFMNIILAILLLSIVFYSIGTPTTTISEVEKNYPAYKAGIKAGDTILTMNGQEIIQYKQIESSISNSQDGTLDITIQRNKTKQHFSISPKYDESLDRYRIGISPSSKKSIIASITTSIEQSVFLTKNIIEVLGQLITGKSSTDSLMGPVGVIAIVNETAKNGLLPIMLLAAQISLNLGIFNLLPIPALDGSRLLFLGIEAIRGKPVDPEKEGMFHFVGFVLLMLLAIFIGYKDIIRFTNFF